MNEIILFDKSYDEKSICDIDRDMSEAFEESELLINKDKHGFIVGSIRLVITYNSES